ncbi:MAG: alpha/beta fold hydrolase [Opitutae bacterium]|nr:alpha/beta fold hydrolase [Opitutae bacterium]
MREKRLLRVLQVPTAPPRAQIEVMVLEPANYGFRCEIEHKLAQNDELATFRIRANWTVPKVHVPLAPRGTIVLLHGIMMGKETMLAPWGLALAEAGYRVILVDLRGHGRSTGEWIGYGAWEADDLRVVLDELDRQGLIAGRIGVLGLSYGAAVALQWAAVDSRVAAVVALAPFSDARRAIREFTRAAAPELLRYLSDADFHAAEERAAHLAGFDWSAVDVLAATRRLHVPVLFFHGGRDTMIVPEHSEALFRVAPAGSRREVLADDNHFTIGLRFDEIGSLVTAWFRERLQSP